MRIIAAVLMAAATSLIAAQSPPPQQVWLMQDSGATAGLRGIDSVDGSVAWASGTGGTILRTIDDGAHWTRCATPDSKKDGATLDFRGIQAWDAQTAIVMASGPGAKSRLYKTTDGCKTWKLILKNREKEGFWDAIYFDRSWGWLLGDPVKGRFVLFASDDGGKHWIIQQNKGLAAKPDSESAFAASNSSLVSVLGSLLFGTGGSGGAFVYETTQIQICMDDCSPSEMNLDGSKNKWARWPVPIRRGTGASGVFSVGLRPNVPGAPLGSSSLIAVGGDYTKPDESAGTAASSLDGGEHWTASATPPHGYRSAVQYSESLHAWITAGTNGSDISRDDGRTWQPLDNGNWNALSLPFVVGPNGRIARLNSQFARLKPAP
ncbi:MAG TPA: hypothetical protein VGR47_03895 [Terracidiphilus sp.]|nr:hypothetical protein [Terracidiphilus sp.]